MDNETRRLQNKRLEELEECFLKGMEQGRKIETRKWFMYGFICCFLLLIAYKIFIMIPAKVFHSIVCCVAILSSFGNSIWQKL